MSLKAFECIDRHIGQYPQYADKLGQIKKLYQDRYDLPAYPRP